MKNATTRVADLIKVTMIIDTNIKVVYILCFRSWEILRILPKLWKTTLRGLLWHLTLLDKE
jgi:hypothetical protein